MRIQFACGLLTICAVAVVGAQTKTQPKTDKPITLSGCVQRGGAAPNQFTLQDDEGVRYRLTGTDVRDYLGRKVMIVGGVPSRRLKIAGGLQPSANAAAQAGNMDPARAATAAAGGVAGPGSVELPEFKVKGVRPVSGSCPG